MKTEVVLLRSVHPHERHLNPCLREYPARNVNPLADHLRVPQRYLPPIDRQPVKPLRAIIGMKNPTLGNQLQLQMLTEAIH